MRCALCAFRTRQVTQKDGDYGFMARKLRLGLAEITARYFLAENAENVDFKNPAEIKEIKEMSPSENVVESIMRSKI